MKTLRRIAVVGLSVVLLLGLARKIHADGAAEISAKIAPASEIDSGAFMAQMGLLNINQRNASFNRGYSASPKLAQLRIVPSNNLATYREFLEKPASLKLRPNPLYLGTWAPVSSANGRNSAIGFRAETITNGLTDQETLIKKTAAHGDSRGDALFGEWTPRMSLQTVDGSRTTSGGDAVIGGGGGAGGAGGGGRNDNSGGEGYAAFARQLEAKGNADTRDDNANHSKRTVKLVKTQGPIFLRTLQFSIEEPIVGSKLESVTSISVDLLSNKAYGTVGLHNTSGGLDPKSLRKLSDEEATQKAKAEIAGWQAYWANPSDGNSVEVGADEFQRRLGQIKNRLVGDLLHPTVPYPDFTATSVGIEGNKVVVRVEEEGQIAAVKTLVETVYPELVGWVEYTADGKIVAQSTERNIADGGEQTFSLFTPLSIEARLDGGTIVLKGNLGKGRDLTIYSDYALNSQTRGQFFVTTNFFNSIQPQRKMTVPELKGLSQAISKILKVTKWISESKEPALYRELLVRIERAINEGQGKTTLQGVVTRNPQVAGKQVGIAAPVLPTLQFKDVSQRDEQRLRDAFISYDAQIKLAQFFKIEFGLESGNLLLLVSKVVETGSVSRPGLRQYKYSAQVYSKLPPYASTTFPTAEEGILAGTLDAVVDARNGRLLGLERTGKPFGIAAPILPTLEFTKVSDRHEKLLKSSLVSYKAQLHLTKFLQSNFGEFLPGNLRLVAFDAEDLSPGMSTSVKQVKYSITVYGAPQGRGYQLGNFEAVVDALTGRLLSLKSIE